MKLKTFLIAGGNPTLLAWDCPPSKKLAITKAYLGKVEQVGFVSGKNGKKALVMMGNELCINSTLALASQCGKNGKIYTSGINKTVNFVNNEKTTTIKLNLPYKRDQNCILFSGIGFLCTEKRTKVTKEILERLALKYKLPAFGIAIYKAGKLTPYVYVKDTQSLFKETACGSASIACNIFTGENDIIQPTGKIIYVKKKLDTFTIEAEVTEFNPAISSAPF